MMSGLIQRGFFFVRPKCTGVESNHRADKQLEANWQVISPAWPGYPILCNIQPPGEVTCRKEHSSRAPFPKIAIYKMNVGELAAWVNDFSKFKKWAEADMYAEYVRQKGVDGKKIMRFKNKDLLYNLGIKKLGHRLDILKMVQDLCSSPRAQCLEQMERYHQRISSYSDSDESVASFDSPYNSAPEPDSACGRWLQRNISGRCERNGALWSDCDHEYYARRRPRAALNADNTNNARKQRVCDGRKIIGNTACNFTEGREISDQREKETVLNFKNLQYFIGENRLL